MAEASAAQKTTLYVNPTSGSDQGSGTVSSPYQTLQKALEVVQPGWRIRLAGGTYSEENETIRDGQPQAPIVIEPSGSQAKPILDGGGTLNAIRVVHDYYRLRGLEIQNSSEGVRLEGTKGVIFSRNYIHGVNNECLRIRYFAEANTVTHNRISGCGLTSNGEGIYIGTAPEQRYKNGGLPDQSVKNLIFANEITGVTEAIDIKEDSSFNWIAKNYVHHTTDPNSAGINVRADKNYLYANISEYNQGAGFRFGGDVAYSPIYGENYQYGVNNTLRLNRASYNQVAGYKFMTGPQNAGCANSGTGNTGPLYLYGSGVEPFVKCLQSSTEVNNGTSAKPKR